MRVGLIAMSGDGFTEQRAQLPALGDRMDQWQATDRQALE